MKDKSDFEAVRAKLNATKEKSKLRGGIKLLDEFPQMLPGENGNVELVKKILSRKEKSKELKEREDSPTQSSPREEVTEPAVLSPKQPRFTPAPIDSGERMDDVADLGNLTAADLRKSFMGILSIDPNRFLEK